MGREIGYYWVKDNTSRSPEWVVAKWDGLCFNFPGMQRPIIGNHIMYWTMIGHSLEIDERRIVRDESSNTGKEG